METMIKVTTYSEARQSNFRRTLIESRRQAHGAEARQILRDMSEALRLGQHDRADALEADLRAVQVKLALLEREAKTTTPLVEIFAPTMALAW